MARVIQHNVCLRLGAALFLLSQVVVTVLTIEHAFEPELHECEVCLAALNDEQDGLTHEIAPSTRLFSAKDARRAVVLTPALVQYSFELRPPPTGPPGYWRFS